MQQTTTRRTQPHPTAVQLSTPRLRGSGGQFPHRAEPHRELVRRARQPSVDGLLTPRQACPREDPSGATCVQRLDGSRDSAIHTTYRISLRSSSMREPRYPLPRVVLFPFSLQESLSNTGIEAVRIGRFVFLGVILRRVPASDPRVGSGRAGGTVAAPQRFFVTRSPVVFPKRDNSNDPSAGSPTETLLRLLLPLNDKVQWTSRDVTGGGPPASPRSEHFTGPFNR